MEQIKPSSQVVLDVQKAHMAPLSTCRAGAPVALSTRVGVVMRRNPDKPVMVWGDRNVPYGEVVILMAALQEAGAPSVGLVTEPPQ